jgi:NAD-dependent dihydropyrimidine dehydrogenase PreA subunit
MSRPIAIITEPCVAVCDTACVGACPVDCIHGPLETDEIRAVPAEERPTKLAGIQLFVNPNECIGCWQCIPVCPVGAIFEEGDVPGHWQEYIEKNAGFFAPSNATP